MTTIRFETCTEFRGSHDDVLVCRCGWLEDDHVSHPSSAPRDHLATVTPVRRGRPVVTMPERRAS